MSIVPVYGYLNGGGDALVLDVDPVKTPLLPLRGDIAGGGAFLMDQNPAIRILSQSAVAVSLANPGHTNETTLATIAVPAGAMGPNGCLRVTFVCSHTNSANNKTLRVRLGGTSFLAPIVTANNSTRAQVEIANTGTLNSQAAFASNTTGFGSNGGSPTTGTVDMSVAQDLTITGQLALGTETITLVRRLVELIPG